MNSKGAALRRHYDKLEPLERFRLAMAAYERGDDGEVSALTRTAPNKTYRMMGWPYAGMLEAVHIVAWACVTDVLRCGVFVMSAWFIETPRGVPDPEETRAPGDGCDWWQVGQEYARAALAAWEGLALFCDEVGITVEQALKHAPAVAEAKLIIKQAETFLVLDADFRRWLAYDQRKLDGVKAEAAMAEGQQRIDDRRQARARAAADLYRQIWDKEAEE